ncbi:MAG: EAL domain-containing protein, partial [Pseudomonadota bacterium]
VAYGNVAVNLSPSQLWAHRFAETVIETVERFGLTPADVSFELTESSALADEETAKAVLNTLAQAGFDIALDDFGTGYASLAHIREYPFTDIKIDRSFITEIGSNGQDGKIADAAIHIAHILDRRIIAEGVETAAQLKWLQNNKCDYAQGYLFSRALEPDDFCDFLKKSRL